MPPLTQRLPHASYRGGDSWRPQEPHSNDTSRTDFTFRNEASAPQYPHDSNRYARPNDNMGRAQKPRPRGYMSNNSGRGPRWATADRPLLSSKRGNSPQPLLSEANTQNHTQRFLPAEDVSDSGEEDMDESDAEDELFVDQNPSFALDGTPEVPLAYSKLNAVGEISEPPAKRRATDAARESKQDSDIPKWSNPDPYTVLPPVDEMQRKRKDVVKIIRKARIAADKEETIENQVAANVDFISFGFGDDKITNEKSRSASPHESNRGHQPGVPGVPTGPRSFSHLNHLHGPDVHSAPGSSELTPSATDLGPPPGLSNGSQAKPGFAAKRSAVYPDQAEALGNRKRTHEDEIKGQAVRVAAKAHKPISSGSILREWQSLKNVDPTPWLIDDHRCTAKSGFRLHKEICDFYEYVRPQRYEQVIREDLLHRLQTVVGKQLPDCSIHCFGSFAAAMYLPNADMDLVVISQTFRTTGRRVAAQSGNQMRNFAGYLGEIGLAKAGSIEVIPSAKVPLVKFVDQMTGIRIDVSFENETGLIANDTFNAWKRQFPAMPILTTMIKQFLMIRGLNEVVNGGLGGFSVTCLVTSLLQNLPRVQNGEVIPEQHLGEILLEFLDLYGNQFDLDRTGISMNPPGYYDKQAIMRNNPRKDVYHGSQRLHKLAILDPNNPDNDISGGSKNVGRIFDLFSQAYDEIMKAMKSQTRISLLDWALGGNYENFTIQRERLRGLYNARWGSPEPYASSTQMISSRPLNIVSNSMFDGAHEDDVMSCALPASVFLNPLDPNVKVEPMMKRKKGKKAKNSIKQKNGAPDPGMSNPQTDQKLSGFGLRNARYRAGLLKMKFPSIAGEIPESISKQERRSLTRSFLAAKVIPHQKKKSSDISTRRSTLKEADKELGGKRKSKKSRKPRAAAALGSASNVPITIG
ncbi:MAG: hypothetical protein Q9213_000393 [Squamulea squamosa]